MCPHSSVTDSCPYPQVLRPTIRRSGGDGLRLRLHVATPEKKTANPAAAEIQISAIVMFALLIEFYGFALRISQGAGRGRAALAPRHYPSAFFPTWDGLLRSGDQPGSF